MLTLDQFGINEEDWNQTPASARAALMFLIQQNQRMENRCAIYQLQVQRLETEMERLKKLELEVAELRERLGQNSQNSSKPPSSDPPSVSRPNNRQSISRRTKMTALDKSVLKRNDLSCPGAPVSLNPNAALKILCFQSLFSENDQFCSPAKQRPSGRSTFE